MTQLTRYLLVGTVVTVAIAALFWSPVLAQMCGGGMHGRSGDERGSVPDVAPRHGKWHHVRMHGFNWEAVARREGKETEELTPVERGEYAVETACAECHGRGGRGGVKNPNYEKGTVPRLDNLAETVGLFEKEHAERAIGLLEKGADLEELRSDPPFDGFARFSAQIESIREVIRDGSEAAPEDPKGRDPVDMPGWGRVLSEREIDGIIAYLLSLQDWEEGEPDEE